MSGCKSWMKYSWGGKQCENPPWEADPEGMCILHSLKPEKDKSAFDQAVKNKLAQEDYDFREVFFPTQISFTEEQNATLVFTLEDAISEYISLSRRYLSNS